MLKSILKKAGSKPWLDPWTFSFKDRRLKSDSIINVPHNYVCEATCDVSSGGIGGLDMDVDYGVTSLLQLSRVDLDYHANMVVVAKHATIINDTGRRSEVIPFAPDWDSLSKAPLVDASIRHDCPYSGDTYFVIVSKTSSVSAMDHNLIPSFIIRKSGVDINVFLRFNARTLRKIIIQFIWRKRAFACHWYCMVCSLIFRQVNH